MSEAPNQTLELAKAAFGLIRTVVGFILWNIWRMKWSILISLLGFGMTTVFGYAIATHDPKAFSHIGLPALCLLFLSAVCAYIDGWDMYPAMKRHHNTLMKKQQEWFDKEMAELDAAEAEDAAE